jgi:histidinol-phosphate phosphatase family protein
MMIRAVFLDRDGTLGGDDTVIYPGQFVLFPFAEEAIKLLKESGVKVFGFTNQPGISRGEATEQDFIDELNGFGLDGAFICPHVSEQNCECRKPKPGMLMKAAQEFDFKLSECVVIGDRWSDMLTADSVNAKKILVITGAGKDALVKYRSKWSHVEPDYVADNVLQAVKWIIDSFA